MHPLRHLGLAALTLVATTAALRAEQRPARLYTTIDGLPRDITYHVEQDSRGFLWVFTGDGLTRFDGSRFVTYTTDDGLPDRHVSDLLETRRGVYWLATDRGLAQFNPRGTSKSHSGAAGAPSNDVPPAEPPMFVVLNPDEGKEGVAFNVLLEDDKGIWCGTTLGLYLLDEAGGTPRFHRIELGKAPANPSQRSVGALLKDRQGAIWVATDGNGLYRLPATGPTERYGPAEGIPAYSLTSLLEDREGRIWVGTRAGGGLYRLLRYPDPRQPVVDRTYFRKDGLPADWITSLYQTHDGTLLAASTHGISVFVPTAATGTPSFQPYLDQSGLCDRETWDLTEDRHGNLWIASTCGLVKISRNGFTAYTEADGLRYPAINSILETREHQLIVVNAPMGVDARVLNRFDGTRFTPTLPPLPAAIRYYGWGWSQIVIQDHLGEWWVPTGANALFRFPRVDRLEQLRGARPIAVYSIASAATPTEFFRVYEDMQGHVWTALDGGRTGLLRWDRDSNALRDVTAQTGTPPLTLFTAFLEDRNGQLWIGTSETGGLLRYRDGRFTRFGAGDGAPSGWLLWFHMDAAGRLWIASSLDGLIRVDDPAATHPRFIKYTTASGLSSNNIRCITSDGSGRIYAGTGRGVDRLDPSTGRISHYTIADGLPKGSVEAAYRDSHGHLWFGSTFGLSRFIPPANDARGRPAVYITGLRVSGASERVSELGEREVPSIAFGSGHNNVSIDYLGLGEDVGEAFQYQYRLAGSAAWSTPTDQRTVNYANLSPGSYGFEVRAVSANGQVSERAAILAFSIAPAIWMRWWFLTASAAALALGAYSVHRYRIHRILEVAAVRSRIATDLHDDIGANLTKIAVLSEVARQQTTDGLSIDRLDSIAAISRESVSAMNDIVWAINPERDAFIDLIRRMRQHALEVFNSEETELRFTAPDADRSPKLEADLRRDFFLIFKEAINNAARHSGASRIEVECQGDERYLTLRVTDNGAGFDPLLETDGHGLMSMRQRAQRLGGELEITSAAERGVTVHVRVPLARRRRVFPFTTISATPRGR